MLLRLIEYPRVITLLTLVLESYHSNTQHWTNVSKKIFASFLPPSSRLQVVLDTPIALSALHQLLAVMDPSAINLQGLFIALLKVSSIASCEMLCRWLALLTSTLKLLVMVFPEETVLSEIKDMGLTPPTFKYVGEEVSPLQWPSEAVVSVSMRLARFLLSTLHTGVGALRRVTISGGTEGSFLSQLLADLLLLLQTLATGEMHSSSIAMSFMSSSPDEYASFKMAIKDLPQPSPLMEGMVSVMWQEPLIVLHYTTLVVSCDNCSLLQWIQQ